MTTDPRATVRRYVLHSLQYLGNALVALQNEEAGKAGELLWGSVAEALHAVAASKNVPIPSHRQLKNFALGLAKELRDESIATDFLLAESFHHNYYEVTFEPTDVAVAVVRIQEMVGKLHKLIPPGVVEETTHPQP